MKTRAEKLNLLKQIASGAASINDLQPAIKFFVVYHDGPSQYFTVSEQRLNPNPTLKLNPQQFEKWEAAFDQNNKRRREKNSIHRINIIPDENCTICYHCQSLPNCLHGCGCEWDDGAMTGGQK